MEFDILKSYCSVCDTATQPFSSHVYTHTRNPSALTTALQPKFYSYKRGDTIVVPRPVSQPSDKSSRHFLSLLGWPHSWPSRQYRSPPAKGCNILYRCISTAKTIFKGSSHPEPPHLQTTKSRHFQSQVSDAVALVSLAPGHSCTWLTLQLSGGSSSKPSRDIHISQALTNTTHVCFNVQLLAQEKAQKQARATRATLRMSG